MGLDERLFGRVHGWVSRRLRRDDPARAARRVTLDDNQKRFATLASLLAGRMLEVRPADDHGGIATGRLYLPAAIDWAPTKEDNVDAFLLRIAMAVAAIEERCSGPRGGTGDARAVATLIAAPAVVLRATRQWAALRGLFARLAPAWVTAAPAPGCAAHAALRALELRILGLQTDAAVPGLTDAGRAFVEQAACAQPADLDACVAAWRRLPRGRRVPPFDLTFWGDLVSAPDDARSGRPDPADAQPPESGDALPAGTERTAPPRREVESVELQEQEDQSPLIHVFEKVKTAEEYQGGRRQLDGSDELGEHLDALEELDMRRVLRSRTPTASIYRADLMLDGGPVDLEDDSASRVGIPYDEWDGRSRSYRTGWCSVFVESPTPADPASTTTAVRSVRSRHAREIRALRSEFEQVERSRALRHRQLHGTDFDLDAVVDRHAALRAAREHGGRVDDERLYTSRRPHDHDLATLVLLDASLSTDSWVQNRRVLDVARESVVVLGEVLNDTRLKVGVAAFFSNARRDCRFQVVKSFDDSWRVGYGRLFGVRPTGYTRIGPALRHAATVLAASGCRKKLLLLVSDGKPTDYDHYEGRHGIADVRQALRESRAQGVRTVALTIDARAKDHLPQMFGDGGYRVLRHPRELPNALARLHERVLS